MHRTMAIIEREMRRFSKSPMLIVMSMVFPLLQLVVLGYAFGGNVKHLTLAIVDQDHGVQAVRVRELAGAVSSGAHTVDLIAYSDRGVAITDLQHYLIPDGFTITGLIVMLAGALLAPFLGESEIFAGPFDALVGACAGAGLIAIVGWLGEAALGREAMGMGDMTLMAFVGAALGPARAISTVFVGATIGAIAFLAIVYPIAMLRRGRTATQTELPLDASQQPLRLPLVPFGVFLAPAAAVMLLWGDRLLGRVFLAPY